MIEFMFYNMKAQIREAFITKKVINKMYSSRFSKSLMDQISSFKFVEPQDIELVYFTNAGFTPEQHAFLRCMYWSVLLQWVPSHVEFSKRVIYYFILDLGVSPFIKSY